MAFSRYNPAILTFPGSLMHSDPYLWLEDDSAATRAWCAEQQTRTAAQLDAMLLAHAKANKYSLDIFYTHSESAAIERLYASIGKIDGLVMNPAAFLFAGYPLLQCVQAMPFPYIEVHMTNIEKRGFKSILAQAAVGVVAGFGTQSYVFAPEAMLELLKARRPGGRKGAKRR